MRQQRLGADMAVNDELTQQLDSDEFRFLKHGVRQVVSPGPSTEWDTVRGEIRTPSGDKIPARVTLFPAKRTAAYSHVGEVRVPLAWLDEFRDDMGRFFFRSEAGEFFSQMQVLEELQEPGNDVEVSGRIILMRDRDAARQPVLQQRDAQQPAISARRVPVQAQSVAV